MEKIIKMINDKIEESKLLTVEVRNDLCSFIDSIIPEVLINDKENIYIEGENAVVNISKKDISSIDYDEYEEIYVVKCNNVLYLLS